MSTPATVRAGDILRDLSTAPAGARRALMQGLIAKRASDLAEGATASLAIIANGSSVPGAYQLATIRLKEAGEQATEQLATLDALIADPFSPEDVRLEAARARQGLVEFSTVLMNAMAGVATC